MDYQVLGLSLISDYQKDFDNFKIINNTQENTEKNIIVNNYYIIHLIELNKYLICECYDKAMIMSTFKIFATYENGLIDVISDITYIGFDFTFHHNSIEYIKWNKYEKCTIYKQV